MKSLVADDQHVATDPLNSAWVAANAGSGKTFILVNRIARLLLSGSAPDRLLCLTFTKAAAAEMSTRLLAKLGRWTLIADDELATELGELGGAAADERTRNRARKLFAEALESPGGLRIQTIHAFCERLLKRFPLEGNVVPQFSVLDEHATEELLCEARDEVLHESAEDDPELASSVGALAQFSGESQFDQLIRSVIAERSWIEPFLHDASRAQIETSLWRKMNLPLHVTEQSLTQDALAHFEPGALRRVASALRKGSKKDVARSAVFDALADQPSGAALDAVLRKVLTVDGEVPANLATKGALDADPGIHTLLEGFGIAAQELARKRNALFIARSTADLLHVAAAILKRYHALKAERAALDYDDLISRAAGLFESPGAAWVLYKLDGGVDHILVDEAQDTSPHQWSIVKAIASEFFAGFGAERSRAAVVRTIFAVGDVKQSIMSFQGARPLEFVKMRKFIETQAEGVLASFKRVGLKQSFRSAPEILKLVDEVFSDAGSGDGVYFDDELRGHEAQRSSVGGQVELWPTVEWPDIPDADAWDAPLDRVVANHPAVTLAQNIADKIAEWLQQGLCVIDKDNKLPRAVTAGDIMILVRRRGLLADEIIRQLKRRSIPVAGADRLRLAQHIAVMDLIALGRFALMPQDDLTLAVVLKGPLCGVSEEALFALAHERGERSLWSILCERMEEPEWVDSWHFLDRVRRRADRVQPFEFYSTVLNEWRGLPKILGRLGFDAADPIEEFLNAALEFGCMRVPSLEAFLHSMEQADTEIKRDQDRGQGAVRVLTVHGSKGLEAPVVILPDTCSTPGTGHHDSNLLQAENVPLWKLQIKRDEPVRAAARATGRLERMREYRRLLYVALTRARDRLVICGYEGKRGNRDPERWYDLVEGAMKRLNADSLVDTNGGSVLVYGPGAGKIEASIGASIPKVLTATLPSWVTLCAAHEPVLVRHSPTKTRMAGKKSEGVGDGSDTALVRGRALHSILEVLGPTSPDRWGEVAMAVARRNIEDAALAQSVAAEALKVRRDLNFNGVFGPGSYGEVPVRGEVTWLGQQIDISGRLDRLVVREHEITIIEFKTDRIVPNDDSAIPAQYLRQLALYRKALLKLFSDRPVNCGIIWTVEPRMTLIAPKYLDDAEHMLDPEGPAS